MQENMIPHTELGLPGRLQFFVSGDFREYDSLVEDSSFGYTLIGLSSKIKRVPIMR